MTKQILKKNKAIRTSLKDRVFKNFRIKLICFFLALFSYVFIGIIQRDEQSFICNLEVNGVKDGFVISNSIPTSVKITVNDRKSILSKISKDDFNVKLTVDAEKAGHYNYNVLWSIPKSVHSFFSTIQVVPDIIPVHLERVVEKSVPTNANYYNLESNYSIKEISIVPQYVRIAGPESYINGITFIDTERISLRGEFESVKRDIPLVPPYPNIRILSRNTATVSFSIISDKITRNFECNKLLFKNLDSEFSAVFKNAPIYVSLTGNKQSLAEISSSDIIISVDCSSIKSVGDYRMPVDVSFMKNAEIVSINPNVAVFTVSYSTASKTEADIHENKNN